MDLSAIRCTVFILMPLLGVKSVHQATIDVVSASKDDTAVLQCYTYDVPYRASFPWPHLINPDGKNWTTVWMKDKKVLHPDDRLKVNSKFTYNFCDTFPGSSEQYTLASGLKAEGGFIKGYDVYKGFGCFVSTLTINKVQESDFGVYQCNYSDFHPKPFRKIHYLANVTLVQTADYISQPKVQLLQSNYILGTNERSRLVQCVSIGTPLDWYYVLRASNFSGCHEKDSECWFNKYAKKVSVMKSDDFWQCFEMNIASHEPKSNQSYESFLFFQNFCVLDNLNVYCGSADGKIVDTKKFMIVIEPGLNGDESRYRGWRIEDAMRIYSGVGIFIVGSLLIAASVVACSRITCPSRVRRSS